MCPKFQYEVVIVLFTYRCKMLSEAKYQSFIFVSQLQKRHMLERNDRIRSRVHIRCAEKL